MPNKVIFIFLNTTCFIFQYSLWAKKVPGETHFLDRAKERYPKYIEDTKILLKVLVLYLPLPVYWALFDQQVS